jgi:LPXTG-motif cell wall-anchored protein
LRVVGLQGAKPFVLNPLAINNNTGAPASPLIIIIIAIAVLIMGTLIALTVFRRRKK